MKIIRLDCLEKCEEKELSSCVIALGNFDGVHLAHQKLLHSTVLEAKKRNLSSAVLTFTYSKNKKEQLSEWEEKLKLFSLAGIQYAVIVDFDSIQKMTPEQFIDCILIQKFDCQCAVCGFNFHFGYQKSGDAFLLQKILEDKNRFCIILPEVRSSDSIVSSTEIREALKNGDPQKAMQLLGRPYSIQSIVLHGQHLGKQLGFPTINQEFPPNAVIPSHGVYCSQCLIDGRLYDAISNIGNKPTIGNFSVLCETHLLDFSGDLYGKNIKTYFLHRLRPEKKFNNLQELTEVIQTNILQAKDFFKIWNCKDHHELLL